MGAPLSGQAQRTWASHVSCVLPASRSDAGLPPPCTTQHCTPEPSVAPQRRVTTPHYVTTDTSKQGCATRHTSHDNPTPRLRHAVPSAHLHLSIPSLSLRVESATLCFGVRGTQARPTPWVGSVRECCPKESGCNGGPLRGSCGRGLTSWFWPFSPRHRHEDVSTWSPRTWRRSASAEVGSPGRPSANTSAVDSALS